MLGGKREAEIVEIRCRLDERFGNDVGWSSIEFVGNRARLWRRGSRDRRLAHWRRIVLLQMVCRRRAEPIGDA